MCRGEAAPGGGALSAGIPNGWRLRAIAAAVIIPPLLEIVSFARIERLLRAMARLQFASVPHDRDSAQWVDSSLSRLPPPWKRTCLRRAAVLYYLLRSSGRPVELCIGVRRDEHGELHAHAWLLNDGVPYVEPTSTLEDIADYTLIAQFPHSAPHSA